MSLGPGIVLATWPAHDCCGEGDGGVEDLSASVVACGYQLPVHGPTKNNLYSAATFVAAFVLLFGPTARLPAWIVRPYRIVFQRFPEPVGIIAPGEQQPIRRWHAAKKGCRTGVAAYLSCGHEEAERAALSVGDRMQLCIHTANGSDDQTALWSLPPLFRPQAGLRAVYPQVGRVNHHGPRSGCLSGEAIHHSGGDTIVAPSYPTAPNGL